MAHSEVVATQEVVYGFDHHSVDLCDSGTSVPEVSTNMAVTVVHPHTHFCLCSLQSILPF